MSKLEKAYLTLQRMEIRAGESPALDVGVNIVATLTYLGFMLSVPLSRLQMLIFFALYPIVASGYLGLRFGGIFRSSLYVLPLVALIGIFNPILDHRPALTVGKWIISEGWITFVSILLRGILAMQAILILIGSCGFLGICRGLRRMHVPSFLTDQLQFVYRYLSVLLLEALSMRRARESRGYGRRSFPIKLWGVMIGQLFLRSIERAERINRAMLARGFNGILPNYYTSGHRIAAADILYLIIAIGAFAVLRFINIAAYFS